MRPHESSQISAMSLISRCILPLFVVTPPSHPFLKRKPHICHRFNFHSGADRQITDDLLISQMKTASSRRKDSSNGVNVVNAGPYRLHGMSIAAVETCIWVPSLSLAIDSGKSPCGAIPMKFMAITHGHCDHVHGLPLHAATRALQRLSPATYFVPPDIVEDVRKLVDAVSRLECAPLKANIVALSPDGKEAVDLGRGKCLRAFRTCHTVPSQGYIVYSKRKKLREEYRGLSRHEIIQLKQQGVIVETESLIPEIAFTGDSTLDAIRDSPDCRAARVVVTEMTFIDQERTPQHARSLGHVHIDDVVENRHLFSDNEHVVFSHFSARYSDEEIRNAMDSLPEELRSKSIAFGVNNAAGQ